MNRIPSPTSHPIPSNVCPARTGFSTPKEKVIISIAEHVSRSPIVVQDSKSVSQRKKRNNWSKHEDTLLDNLLKSCPRGRPHWKEIADQLNRTLGSTRNGKQCRERWRNHLRPNIKKGGWTIQEEHMIRKMYLTFGPKWTCMAQFLKNRTDNDIKNKWYSMYRSAKTQQRVHEADQLISATFSFSQNSVVTHHDEKLHNTAQAPDFPPPFSLSPIPANPVVGYTDVANSGESASGNHAAISFTCSWGDLSF